MKKTICNMCGKEFDEWDEQEDFRIEKKAGYGTFFDGFHIRLDLCCTCMEDIVMDCAVSPVSETDGEPVDLIQFCKAEDSEE